MKIRAALTPKIAAVSIVVFEQNRFLLIERKYPPFQGFLSFPGGKVERGEAPPQAAARELYEETALIAHELKFLLTLDLHEQDEAPSPTLLSVYHALSTSGQACPGDDASALFWYNVSQMQARPLIPSVLVVAKAMESGQMPVFASKSIK